ncbi:putative reverse transcriptase domain-containing protein [Tanacetum coccineum]
MRQQKCCVAWTNKWKRRKMVVTEDGIPLIGDVRTIIMDETHAARYLVHLGVDKTYYDLGDMHWWPCMKKYVATYVSNCLTCSKVKAETSNTFGYMKRLQDEKLERIYIDEIVARHGVPVSIISDCDGRSTSSFCRRCKSVRKMTRYVYHSSIRCAPFEALYGRRCRLPVLWAEIGESWLIGLELVQETTDKGELSSVHDTFHVSNLKKCLADANLHVPLDEIKIDKTLRFVEEPVEIIDREVKSLKHSKIPIVKVRWNSKCGPEFTWER